MSTKVYITPEGARKLRDELNELWRVTRPEVVDRVPDDQDTVYFGAWVRLENENGEITRLRIVGSDEFDPALGWISLESPMAKSLIGKKIGTSINLALPSGPVELDILDVSYSPLPE